MTNRKRNPPAKTPNTSSTATVQGKDESASQQTLNGLLVASENAYTAKDFALAARIMQKVVKIRPDDAALHYRLGVCHQQAGSQHEAELSFRKAILCDQSHESAYQGLIQALVARSDPATAVNVCQEQMRHCGETPALSAQMVTLLVAAGRPQDALDLVSDVNNSATEPQIDQLRLEAELAFRTGHLDQAIKAAHSIHEARPDDTESAIRLAQYLCADKRYALAIPVLESVLRNAPTHVEGRNLLKVSLAETGNYRAALATTESLLKSMPHSVPNLLFAATLANLLGQSDVATAFLLRAHDIEPDNAELCLSLANQYGNTGDFEKAISLLDHASMLDTKNQALIDTRLRMLAERGNGFMKTVSSSRAKLQPLPRLTERQRTHWKSAAAPGFLGFLHSLRIKSRVISGLVMRELSHRSAQSKIGIASNLIEPMLQIVFLGAVLSLFNSGRPPLGDKLFFFYATGVMPFYLFLHVINYSINTFSDNQSMLQIPLVNRLDLVIATSLCEFLIGTGTTIFIFTGFHLFGAAPHTDNIVEALYAYSITFLLAYGIGLITATLNNLNKMIGIVWQSFQRVLYVASGVFYLPQSMPDWVRDILVWNPLLQCIEWFRTGFFPQYAPPWLDKMYLLGTAAALIVLGTMLQSAMKRRLRTT